MMRVVTIVGTRPEIIRLSGVIPLLDRMCEHTLVHTGQNYEPTLSEIFFQELGIRPPDSYLGVRGDDFSDQVGSILSGASRILDDVRPDRLLVLGDTNSGLSALVAARRRIPVYHMEAGNRCYDDRVPEEINRRIIDHCSSVLMPYTARSAANLLREGIERERIFVTGNPIFDVLERCAASIDRSDVLERLNVEPRAYCLATLHRSENVDEPARLAAFLDAFALVAERFGKVVIVSVHPRTADQIQKRGLEPCSESVRMLRPFGFFDFVKLEQNAFCVLTDSGTVQEECCILRIPNVTLRDVTERPETIECGSGALTGCDPGAIATLVELVTSSTPAWVPPEEYTRREVASAVAKIVLRHHDGE